MSTMRLGRAEPEKLTAATEPTGSADVRWPQPSSLDDWWQRVVFGAAPAAPEP